MNKMCTHTLHSIAVNMPDVFINTVLYVSIQPKSKTLLIFGEDNLTILKQRAIKMLTLARVQDLKDILQIPSQRILNNFSVVQTIFAQLHSRLQEVEDISQLNIFSRF